MYPGQEPQPIGVPGTTSGRSVHFTSHSRQPVPEEAEARFRFRLTPRRWLVQSALLTVGVAVVASLVTLAYTKSLADPTRSFVEGSGVLSVGMALLSVAIALLARSGHELVARTQGNYRGLHLGLSAVTFIAAVSTAFPGQVPSATGSATRTLYDTVWVHARWLIWLGTALYAWSFALLQAAGWALRRFPDKRRPWWGALQVTIAVGTLSAMLSGTPREATALAGLGAWGLAYAARAAILRQAASQLARRTVRVPRIAGQ